jgi:hypothetical protein
MKARSLLAAAGAVLVLLSLFFAFHRSYQVDEAQNVTMARIIATHRTAEAYTNAPLFLLPLAPFAALSDRSADLFHVFRVLFFALFWANTLLIVRATGAALRSREGVLTLAFAATLGPLWTYGLEVRHDNIQLSGLLLIWILMRPMTRPFPAAYFWIGFLAASLQFSLLKAFAYWVPLAVAALVLPHPAFKRPRIHLLAESVLGATAAAALYALLRLWWGIEEPYVSGFSAGLAVATRVTRLAPWPTLARLVLQAPLLTAAAIFAVALCLRDFLRAGWRESLTRELTWGAALFTVALTLLVLNPTPFPYNLLLLAPPAAVAAALAVRAKLLSLWDQGLLKPWAVALLVGLQLLPFAKQLSFLASWRNARQEELMDAAELLTDPRKDTVMDLAGLVPTRPGVGFWWFANLTNYQTFQADRSLVEHPAPVFIPNYRVGYLSKEQDAFVRENYRALAGDLLVLGANLSPGASTWLCRHPGRYVLAAGSGPARFRVDGVRREPGIYHFGPGEHRIESEGAGPVVFWAGPALQAPLRLSDGSPGLVFPSPGAF